MTESGFQPFVVSMPLSDDGKLVVSLSSLSENKEHSLIILDARTSPIQMMNLNGFERITEFANFLAEYVDVFLESEDDPENEEPTKSGPMETDEVNTLFQSTFIEN